MSIGSESDLRQLDDEALVRLLVSGEKDALNIIMERHRAMVLAIARRIVRDDAEAEDTAQDVFLEALHLTKFDTDYGNVAAWLRKTTQRRALNRRKHLNRRGFYLAEPLDEEVAAPASVTQTPETARRTKELLERLEPKEREVMILKYLHGHTDKEIAGITGDSIRTVRHTLSRSRRRLKSAT